MTTKTKNKTNKNKTNKNKTNKNKTNKNNDVEMKIDEYRDAFKTCIDILMSYRK